MDEEPGQINLASLRGDETIRVHEIQRFDLVMRSFHWLTLLLIISVFSTAALIDDADPASRKVFITHLHRSLGLTVWACTLARLAWRQFARLPDWPAGMPKIMQIAARYSELLLYALLIVQPVLGLLYTNSHGDKVYFFFLFRLSSIVEQNDELGETLIELHELTANILFAIIAMHALAALYHHFIRRDEVLSRMLPKAAQYRLAFIRRDGRAPAAELYVARRDPSHSP